MRQQPPGRRPDGRVAFDETILEVKKMAKIRINYQNILILVNIYQKIQLLLPTEQWPRGCQRL